MSSGLFQSENFSSGTPADTQLNDGDRVFLQDETPAPADSAGSSRQAPPVAGPALPRDQFPKPTEAIPAAGFAHAWNALLLNRGHHVWGSQKPLSPIVSRLLFMVNNRPKFGSGVMQALAAAVAANAHLGPILRQLSTSSSSWPTALLTLARVNGKFPVAHVRNGISGFTPGSQSSL